MQFKDCAHKASDCFLSFYGRIFHQRNIIIVSEHKVKHLPIGTGVQLAVLLSATAGICWASYYTGSYYAAKNALKEQSLTLKSVVNDKVESNFSMKSGEAATMPATTSKSPLVSVDQAELFARIVELEGQLKQSEQSKKEFIEKVHEKTAKNIDSFEDLIAQTGLDLDTLKKQVPASKTAEKSTSKFDRQGGPYVPSSVLGLTAREDVVMSSLDELSALRQIVDNLPVRKPMPGYQEMSQFGRRIDPFTGHLAFHSGVDLAGPAGSKIHATADGVVSSSGRLGAYGNMVDVDHGFKVSTRYAHLSEILVNEGDVVKKGDVIGIQGSTGRSTGAHLHYEVRYNNQPMNPVNFLTAGRYVPKN